MKNLVLVLISMTLLAPLAASAKPYHSTSVRWIVETRNNISEDDKYVTLVGHVTRRLSDEEYWFTDGTGSIRLDSENFDLPINRRIVVGGRIDQAYLGFGHIEVDVRRWHYAPLPKKAVAARPAPVTHVAAPTPPPAPVRHEAAAPASALAPAPEPAPAPVVATAPPAPPAAPPTPTTSTTMNASPVATPPLAPTDVTTNAPSEVTSTATNAATSEVTNASSATTNATPLTPPVETK